MKTILLVDDDLDLADAIADLFNEQGFHVDRCQDGREALEKLEHTLPDLLLMDGHMPVMGGLEAIKKIRGNIRYKNLPIILMSAETPTALQTEYQWTHFVKKPLQFNELILLIYALLGTEK